MPPAAWCTQYSQQEPPRSNATLNAGKQIPTGLGAVNK